jgi:hypothetical protein
MGVKPRRVLPKDLNQLLQRKKIGRRQLVEGVSVLPAQGKAIAQDPFPPSAADGSVLTTGATPAAPHIPVVPRKRVKSRAEWGDTLTQEGEPTCCSIS